MNAFRTAILITTSLVLVTPTMAQPFDIKWYSIDSGGATTPSTGGAFGVAGTIGQPEAGAVLSGGVYTFTGGFWAGIPSSCYANCDGSSVSPVLTANDFQCFLNRFAANDPYANCDSSTGTPALTANDFQCFINKFASGCS